MAPRAEKQILLIASKRIGRKNTKVYWSIILYGGSYCRLMLKSLAMKQATQTIDEMAYKHRLKQADRELLHASFLQQEIAKRLFDQLQLMTIKPEMILDVSHYAGHTYSSLQQLYPKSECIHVSAVEAIAESNHVIANNEKLPFENASVDLIVSHLSFDWQSDLMMCFKEFARVLKKDGLLIFSMYGPGTLQELRYAFSQVSEHPHVHAFFDMHDIGDWLMQSGLTEPVMVKEMLTLRYATLDLLFKDLRQSASQNTLFDRARGLMGKQCWQKMLKAYEVFRENGKLPATFEIAFGHAWKPQLTQTVEDNEVRVSIESISRASRS